MTDWDAPLLIKLSDVDLRGRTVFLRTDYNVPIHDGRVGDATRIVESLPTLRMILAAEGVKLLIVSHLGRPKEGVYDERHSLQPVAECLSRHCGRPVPLVRDWVDGVDMRDNDVVLCENVRFLKGETGNDDELARKMAKLCNVYVNDAFATCHRSHASTCGVAKYVSLSCAGLLLMRELKTLGRVMRRVERPFVMIVGGAKLSDRLSLLRSMVERADVLLLGGGIVNTFLKAQGHELGGSLYQAEFVDEAVAVMRRAQEKGCALPLPTDVVCAPGPDAAEQAAVKPVSGIAPDDMVLDIGPESVARLGELMRGAGTIVWSGPLGRFENPAFAEGTCSVARQVAASPAYSVVGGGDTVAALGQAGVAGDIDCISTGGSAFLQFIENRPLPALSVLDEATRAWESMERARDM